MWKRKDLKREARGNLKQNYWMLILVCFIMAFMFAEYGASTSLIQDYSNLKARSSAVNDSQQQRRDNSKVVNSIIGGIGTEKSNDAYVVTASKGVLAKAFNGKSNGTPIMSLMDTITKFANTDKHDHPLIALGGLIMSILFFLFVRLMLIVGERRFFLENKNYPKTSISRLLYLYKERNIFNTMKVLLMKILFLILWGCTIVMLPVKLLAYSQVEYILAENPDIKWKDAITLSRRMMNGNKWRVFVLAISFWYWYVLKSMTFGLLGIFFLNPYLRATEVELYAVLRKAAKDKGIEGSELMNDELLWAEEDAENQPKYPGTVSKHRVPIKLNYDRKYSIVNLILFFFIFSVIGWCWEVSLHLIQDGVFVNRGTMYGPWLPIYGTGGMIVLFLLQKFRDRPPLMFLMTMIVCGIVEYSSSCILEYTKGKKWWDYSGYLLNINGRICLEGLLVFAIAGCLLVYILAPIFDDLLNKIPMRARIILLAVVAAVFAGDAIHSSIHPNTGAGITSDATDVCHDCGDPGRASLPVRLDS